MEPTTELIEGSRRAAQAVPMQWRRAFRRRALEMAKAGHEFTSEDVTSDVRTPAEVGAPSNNSIGRMMAELNRQGWIRCVGFRASTRTARRGGGVRVWQGTEKAKDARIEHEEKQTEIAVR